MTHCSDGSQKGQETAEAIRNMKRDLEDSIAEPLLCNTYSEWSICTRPTPLIAFADQKSSKLYEGEIETDYHYSAGVSCGNLIIASYKIYVEREAMLLKDLRKKQCDILGHLSTRQNATAEELMFYKGLCNNYAASDLFFVIRGQRAQLLYQVHALARRLLRNVIFATNEEDRTVFKIKALNVLTRLDESIVLKRPLIHKKDVDYFAEGKKQGELYTEIVKADLEMDQQSLQRLYAEVTTHPVLIELQTKLAGHERTEPELFQKFQLFNKGCLHALQCFDLDTLLGACQGDARRKARELYATNVNVVSLTLACTNFAQVQQIFKGEIDKQLSTLPDVRIDITYQSPLFVDVQAMKSNASYKLGYESGKEQVRAYSQYLDDETEENAALVLAFARVIRKRGALPTNDEQRFFDKGWSDSFEETSLEELLKRANNRQKKDNIREAFNKLATLLKTATHARDYNEFRTYMAKYVLPILTSAGVASESSKSRGLCIVS